MGMPPVLREISNMVKKVHSGVVGSVGRCRERTILMKKSFFPCWRRHKKSRGL